MDTRGRSPIVFNNAQFRSLFKKAVKRAIVEEKEIGTLGRKNTDGTITIPVRGRAGFVYVTRRDQTSVEAINKGGVPLTDNYPVEIQEEQGRYVVLSRSVHPSLPMVADDPIGSGGGSFLDLTDTTPTTYVGQSAKVVAVNALETGLEFVEAPEAALPDFGEFEMVNITPVYADFSTYNAMGIVSALTITKVDPQSSDPYHDITARNVDALGALATGGWGITHVPGQVRFETYNSAAASANFPGSNVSLVRNGHATTPGAGFVTLFTRSGSGRRIWVDNTGVVRVNTADPTNANDTAGTVVGSQTSYLASKDILGSPVSPEEALVFIQAAARDAIKRFKYKKAVALEGEDASQIQRPFKGDEFSGIVVDLAPRYGMDRDAEHPAGKSLNPINAIGDLMLAVSGLADRLKKAEDINKTLSDRLALLEKKVKL